MATAYNSKQTYLEHRLTHPDTSRIHFPAGTNFLHLPRGIAFFACVYLSHIAGCLNAKSWRMYWASLSIKGCHSSLTAEKDRCYYRR
ncbi:hypothetical protein TNIN_186371 [Trichonephila inaurata madagascariensis]|uniref:Uncharacterized protein n=1 Tax=Trichonephila inaurata madagascariensis TaxID=2747483 RepID=A0A8X6WZK9_9ARAC|nr:hypothetical protein TNIN_269071 [Trichonephila inaurata madagascariensis]GFY56472.1 hypothetical protein TNIN_186371 [Trichonephila inaurata madagascariensis]